DRPKGHRLRDDQEESNSLQFHRGGRRPERYAYGHRRPSHRKPGDAPVCRHIDPQQLRPGERWTRRHRRHLYIGNVPDRGPRPRPRDRIAGDLLTDGWRPQPFVDGARGHEVDAATEVARTVPAYDTAHAPALAFI